MIESTIYLIKDGQCYVLRWSDNVNYLTVENDNSKLSLNNDAAFDLIDRWYKAHFKE